MLDISELFHCQFELNSVFFCKCHYPVELCKLLNMKNTGFICIYAEVSMAAPNANEISPIFTCLFESCFVLLKPDIGNIVRLTEFAAVAYGIALRKRHVDPKRHEGIRIRICKISSVFFADLYKAVSVSADSGKAILFTYSLSASFIYSVFSRQNRCISIAIHFSAAYHMLISFDIIGKRSQLVSERFYGIRPFVRSAYKNFRCVFINFPFKFLKKKNSLYYTSFSSLRSTVFTFLQLCLQRKAVYQNLISVR